MTLKVGIHGYLNFLEKVEKIQETKYFGNFRPNGFCETYNKRKR